FAAGRDPGVAPVPVGARAEISAMSAAVDRARAGKIIFYAVLLAFMIAAPLLVPAYRTQLSFLWLMIVFALTWDILGGQMGYNSFGNIVFFGVGMYACAVFQRDAGLTYFPALFAGMGLGAVLAV